MDKPARTSQHRVVPDLTAVERGGRRPGALLPAEAREAYERASFIRRFQITFPLALENLLQDLDALLEPGKPEMPELRIVRRAEEWKKKWNLQADWIEEWATEFLHRVHFRQRIARGAQARHPDGNLPNASFLEAIFPLIVYPETPHYHHPVVSPEPLLESRVDFLKRAEEAWISASQAMKTSGARYTALTPTDHLDWFISYQFKKTPFGQIAKADTEKKRSAKAVERAVKKTATVLGFALRDSTPGGRPKKVK
ncbi:MAG TPA: hypothetical protein VES67_11720 [Vicinamibacterales bacterium]|nr:hypothetical protein [Vicinamibacterales bacterium]